MAHEDFHFNKVYDEIIKLINMYDSSDRVKEELRKCREQLLTARSIAIDEKLIDPGQKLEVVKTSDIDWDKYERNFVNNLKRGIL